MLTDELADEETLDKPSDAFDVAFEALSLAFEAVEEAVLAASDVVDALRTGTRPNVRRAGRNAARASVVGMVGRILLTVHPVDCVR